MRAIYGNIVEPTTLCLRFRNTSRRVARERESLLHSLPSWTLRVVPNEKRLFIFYIVSYCRTNTFKPRRRGKFFFFNPFTTPALDVNETRQSPVIAPPMIFHEMEVEKKSIVVDPQMRRKIIIKSVESQFIKTQQLVCFISTRGIHWCVGLILADRHPVCIPLNG